MTRVNDQGEAFAAYSLANRRDRGTVPLGGHLPKVAWSLLMLSAVMSVITGIALRDRFETRLRTQSFAYLLQSARDADQQGNPTRADSIFSQLVERYPGKEEGLLAYAEFLSQHGRAAEAGPMYERALATGRQANNALVRYTNFLDSQGDSQRAVDECRAYLASYPDDAWAQFELGRRLLWQGDPDGAIPHLKQASTDTALKDAALRKLGDAYARKNDFQKAIDVWTSELGIHASVETRQVLYDIALAYRKLGEVDKAEAALREHLEYFPNSIWTLTALEALYAEMNNTLERGPVNELLDAMKPAVTVNQGLGRFISLSGITPHFAEVKPGQSLALDLHLVFFDAFTSGALPQARFVLEAEGAPPIPLVSFPPRLGPVPVWRGDHVAQTFALKLPADLAPGSYQLVLTTDPDTGRPVRLCAVQVAHAGATDAGIDGPLRPPAQ